MATVAEDAMWAGDRRGRARRAVAGGAGSPTSRTRSSRDPQGRPLRIVEGYGGHGIGSEMHQDPFVLNYGRPGRGRGSCPAVPGHRADADPGPPKTVELDDGWTVVTADGSPAVHVEHTIAICEDGAWVLTAADGGPWPPW
jgi:methionyl aminopeptidase